MSVKHKFTNVSGRRNSWQYFMKNTLNTGRSVALVPHNVEIKGRKNLLTNAVVVSKNKSSTDIYYTSSSTNFDLTDAVYEVLTKGSGRLYKYDIQKNASEGKVLFKSCLIFLVTNS